MFLILASFCLLTIISSKLILYMHVLILLIVIMFFWQLAKRLPFLEFSHLGAYVHAVISAKMSSYR